MQQARQKSILTGLFQRFHGRPGSANTQNRSVTVPRFVIKSSLQTVRRTNTLWTPSSLRYPASRQRTRLLVVTSRSGSLTAFLHAKCVLIRQSIAIDRF
jgi:hypothetical protein